MRSLAMAAAITCLMLVPVAGAEAARVPLSARMDWDAAARFDGLLVAGVGDRHENAFVQPGPDAIPLGQKIMAAEHVVLVLHRWTGGTPQQIQIDQPASLPVDDANRVYVEDAATLTLTGLWGNSQVLIDDGTEPVKPLHAFDAGGVSCAIDPARQGKTLLYPAGIDPNQQRQHRDQAPDQLRADCSLSGLTSANPSRAFLYDMTVRLDSSSHTEEIRTGTWSEPGAAAGDALRAPDANIYLKVTQVLEIQYANAPLTLTLPGQATATLFASRFDVAGHFAFARSDGRLTWGPTQREGDLDPFSATGTFALTRAHERAVAVEGATVEHPPAMAEVPAAASRTTPIAVAVAVGLTFAALTVFALWPLFSTLSPEALLEHPRRREILEIVRTQPGVETMTVAEDLGMRWAIVAYHTRLLERGGHLSVQRIGGRRALFPANAGLRGKETQLSLLRRDTARRVYDLLTAEPGLDQSAIAARLGRHQSQVSRWLRSMEESGLVTAHMEARRRRYSAATPPPTTPSPPVAPAPA